MTRLIALAVAALALGAAACGGSEPDSYSPQVEEAFTDGCVERAMETSKGRVPKSEAEEYCSCTYDDIAANVPFEEFAEYDERVQEEDDAPPPRGVTRAAERCRAEQGYSKFVENTFEAECIEAGAAGDDGFTEAQAKEFCGCTFADIKATVPFEIFAEYDEKSRKDPDAPIPPKIRAAIDRCVAEVE